MKLHAGNIVYRVVEVDPPEKGLHTWNVTAIGVERASAKQIKLNTFFPGHFGVQFDPSALGSVFFETALQAIQFFLTAKRLEIESLDRRRKEAERAIVWAISHEGVTYT